MKRLGMFTGTVYDENYDFSKCPECCTCINDDLANNAEKIQEHHLKDLAKCLTCFGCPASKTACTN